MMPSGVDKDGDGSAWRSRITWVAAAGWMDEVGLWEDISTGGFFHPV